MDPTPTRGRRLTVTDASAALRRARPARLRPGRTTDLAIYLPTVGLGLVAFIFYQRVETYWSDSSTYIGLAQSLAEHGSYQFNFAPHTLYPPGLPALLALLSLAIGPDYSVYLRFVTLAGLLGLVAAYHLLRYEQGRAAATVSFLLLGFSPEFFKLITRQVNSDIPFFFTSMASLVLATTLHRAASPRGRWVLASAFALTLLCSVMIRSAGIALLSGLCLWLAITWFRQREALGRLLRAFLPAIVVVIVAEALWVGWTTTAKTRESPDPYAAHLWARDAHRPELGRASATDLLVRATNNIVAQSAHFAEIITRKEWIEPLWYSPPVLGVLGLLLLGVGVTVWQRRDGYPAWYLFSYTAVYLLWPYDEGVRYVLPVFPLAFLYVWRGALATGTALRNRAAVAVGGFVAAGVVIAVLAARLLGLDQAAGRQAQGSIAFWVGLAAACILIQRTGIGRRAAGSLWSQLSWRARLSLGRRPVTPLHVVGAALVGVLVVVGAALQIGAGLENLAPDPRSSPQYPLADAARWVQSNTAPNDVVMAGQTAIVHRLSGRKVVAFPATSRPQIIVNAIREHHVAYLIALTADASVYLRPTEPERLQLLLDHYPRSFRVVHEGWHYRIFRIERPGAAAVPGDRNQGGAPLRASKPSLAMRVSRD